MKNPRALPARFSRPLARVIGMRLIGVRGCDALARAVPLASVVTPIACAAAPLEHSALAPAGVQAQHIVRLWDLTLVLCGCVFAAVLAGVLFALWKRRSTDAAAPPALDVYVQPEHRTQRAVVWASMLSVVLLVALIVADVVTDRALSKLPISVCSSCGIKTRLLKYTAPNINIIRFAAAKLKVLNSRRSIIGS